LEIAGGAKHLCFLIALHTNHCIALVLGRFAVAEQKEHIKQRNSMNQLFKATALLAIEVQQLVARGSGPHLTTGANRSLRPLGRPNTRPSR